jgi:hypothetical protein
MRRYLKKKFRLRDRDMAIVIDPVIHSVIRQRDPSSRDTAKCLRTRDPYFP